MTDLATYRAKLVARRNRYIDAGEMAKAAVLQWCIELLKGQG